MTKKHFKEAARIISNISKKSERSMTAAEFANIFRKLNKKFDPKYFFEACNVEYKGN
ncbi:hypothetical protein LCGC14_1428540 [marine sediment metagenome]|uniref:Uncharacterized protein n=1 Tax=marine sediment metagenome TaxID=412755 RepID=A0A0F9M4R8_9ZZZZ